MNFRGGNVLVNSRIFLDPTSIVHILCLSKGEAIYSGIIIMIRFQGRGWIVLESSIHLMDMCNIAQI